jgi:hypothetical protein
VSINVIQFHNARHVEDRVREILVDLLDNKKRDWVKGIKYSTLYNLSKFIVDGYIEEIDEYNKVLKEVRNAKLGLEQYNFMEGIEDEFDEPLAQTGSGANQFAQTGSGANQFAQTGDHVELTHVKDGAVVANHVLPMAASEVDPYILEALKLYDANFDLSKAVHIKWRDFKLKLIETLGIPKYKFRASEWSKKIKSLTNNNKDITVAWR